MNTVIGKQISYYVYLPDLRKYIISNTSIVFVLTGINVEHFLYLMVIHGFKGNDI
jgi:hypothetical protein